MGIVRRHIYRAANLLMRRYVADAVIEAARTLDRIGGPQIITDVAVDPAGNVWVANNWDLPEQGFKKVPEPALSTRFGANGTVVF
jgi:hypothetical protein